MKKILLSLLFLWILRIAGSDPVQAIFLTFMLLLLYSIYYIGKSRDQPSRGNEIYGILLPYLCRIVLCQKYQILPRKIGDLILIDESTLERKLCANIKILAKENFTSAHADFESLNFHRNLVSHTQFHEVCRKMWLEIEYVKALRAEYKLQISPYQSLWQIEDSLNKFDRMDIQAAAVLVAEFDRSKLDPRATNVLICQSSGR